MRVTCIYSEDENVLDAKPVNNPKRLWDAMENSHIIETNNMAVVDYFRVLVKERKIDKGVVRYQGEDFELDKDGRYITFPSYDDEVINTYSRLL